MSRDSTTKGTHVEGETVIQTAETVAQIGALAGKIWHYLEKNGQSSPSRIAKELKAQKKDIDRAVGWLAREGKLEFGKAKRGEVICLA